MAKYYVPVYKTMCADLEIEANGAKEAKKKALKYGSKIEWEEMPDGYEVGEVSIIEEQKG